MDNENKYEDSVIQEQINIKQQPKNKNPIKKVVNKFLLIATVVVMIVTVVVGVFRKGNNSSATVYKGSSDLMETVDIAKLSTSKFVYNGIAFKYENEKKKEKNEYKYCVRYKATVKATVNADEIEIETNNDNKTITVKLPPIELQPTVDESDLDYMPDNPNAEVSEILQLCKEDVEDEANNSAELIETAEENLKAIIEGVITPVVESEGYEIVWEDK